MARRPSVFQARRKAQKKARTEAFHHNVYVVLLKPEVARLRKVRRENPIRLEERPCVYQRRVVYPPRRSVRGVVHVRLYESSARRWDW